MPGLPEMSATHTSCTNVHTAIYALSNVSSGVDRIFLGEGRGGVATEILKMEQSRAIFAADFTQI